MTARSPARVAPRLLTFDELSRPISERVDQGVAELRLKIDSVVSDIRAGYDAISDEKLRADMRRHFPFLKDKGKSE